MIPRLEELVALAINLDRRDDRWRDLGASVRHFDAIQRVQAVDGQSLPDSDWRAFEEAVRASDAADAQKYSEGVFRGQLGCLRSWVFATEIALNDLGSEWVAIIEDDLRFVDGAAELFDDARKMVPDDAMIFCLGGKHRRQPEAVDRDEVVFRVNWIHNTTGIIANREGLERLHDRWSAEDGLIDWIWNDVHAAGRSYCTSPHLAIQADGHSDIAGRKTTHASAAELGPPLRAKSAYTNEEVADTWATIGERIDRETAEEAIEEAVAEVRATVGTAHRACYGWSGGKDSLALQVVMEEAGIRDCVLGIVGSLEFREYLLWVKEHAPPGLAVYSNPNVTLEYLGQPENRRYVFPDNHKDGYFWTLAGTRRAQLLHQERHSPDLQIFGRRKADGNECGDERGILRGAKMTSYAPLRDWSHEMVLAVIYHRGLEIPPTYSWPHGWTAGTGPWPGRRVGTIEESWAETFEIEPDAVRAAAAYLPSAWDYLESIGEVG